MVSQLLFGEFAHVTETAKDFTKVKCLFDGYEGWCQTSQLAETDETTTQQTPLAYTLNNGASFLFDGVKVPVGGGVPIYSIHEMPLGRYMVQYTDGIDRLFTTEDLVRFARSYLHAPYLWGGRSSAGIDCSGFSQQVMKLLGVALLRDSGQQALQGEDVGFLQETRPGDLAFFDNEEGRIIHVGILLAPDTIIHASGRVRIDTIDHEGIVNGDTGLRSHRLRVIRRVWQPVV